MKWLQFCRERTLLLRKRVRNLCLSFRFTQTCGGLRVKVGKLLILQSESVSGTKRTQRAQSKSSALRLKAGLQPRSGEQTEILARHPVALGNTRRRCVWLGVAPCGEVRHSKMKK